MKTIFNTIILVVAMLTLCTAQVNAVTVPSLTLTVGSGSGNIGSTIEVPITVNNPEGIAGAAFTLVFNSALSVSVESDFFDTFVNQFAACGLTQDQINAIEIPQGYSQPLITNLSAAGDQIKIAAARCQPAASDENPIMFTLRVSLKNGQSAGTYSIGIIPTTLDNAAAGYAVPTEIDLLIGSDLTQAVASGSAFPVILDNVGYAEHVVPGQIIFDGIPINDPNIDDDGDGYTENQGDLNDNEKTVYPDAPEICNDTLDNDQDGKIDCLDEDCGNDPGCEICTDADGDGYYAEDSCGTGVDCDDNDKDVHPGAEEILGDGKDNDCDGTTDVLTKIFYDQYYLASNTDVAQALNAGSYTSGWEHYFHYGSKENRIYAKPAEYGDFNETYYLAGNLDVAHAVANGWFLSGWEHYRQYGKNEPTRSYAQPAGYDAFNEEYYLANNPDVAYAVRKGSFLSGWEHYIQFGKNEPTRIRTKPADYGAFNEEYYLAGNLDVAHAVAKGDLPTGWYHYQYFGQYELSRSFAEPIGYGAFNEEYYLANNPDVAYAVAKGGLLSGWEHYYLWGKNEPNRSYAQPVNDKGVAYGGVSPE